MPVPPRILPVLEDARRAEEKFGVDCHLILGVLDRETLCGQSPVLDKDGPGGSGDFLPRFARKYEKRPDLLPHLRIWKPSREEFRLHFAKVVLKTGEAPPELCMPSDGLGWGRGLGQIDLAAHTAWCLLKRPPAFLWELQDENINKVASILHACLLSFDGNVYLAAAAYNAGPGNVRRAILRLSSAATDEQRERAADSATTGGDYARDVVTRAERFRRQLTFLEPTA